MKNGRAIWMIVISLLLGLAAVLVAGKWVIQRTSVEASTVIIAAQDIDVGTRLTPDLLQSTDWPRASMPPGSFQESKLLDSRVVKVNLVRGEPLLESKLAPVGATVLPLHAGSLITLLGHRGLVDQADRAQIVRGARGSGGRGVLAGDPLLQSVPQTQVIPVAMGEE